MLSPKQIWTLYIAGIILSIVIGIAAAKAYQSAPKRLQSITITLPYALLPSLKPEILKVADYLRSAKADILNLNLSGIGGVAAFMEILGNAIIDFKQHNPNSTVIAYIDGVAISAHAFMACYADKWVFLDSNSALLFHQMYAGARTSQGFTYGYRNSQTFKRSLKLIEPCNGKLTKDQIEFYKNSFVPGVKNATTDNKIFLVITEQSANPHMLIGH